MQQKKLVHDSAAWFLVAANLIPIAGVIFFSWSLTQIMLLYWLETAIIGFYTIIKMLLQAGIFALFHIVFFMVHFGMFMGGHFMGIGAILTINTPNNSWDYMSDLRMMGFIPIAALLVSHGYSFIQNFEWPKKGTEMHAMQKSFADPYKRVILMHCVVLFGAFAVGFTGVTTAALFILVGLKILTDLYAHARKHSLLLRNETPKK
ncbi:MAG TPA: DUF6498-containing protein [Patescibacteria group bacterium]|nr:DUF6498-containing protein [Patescibacteria group bacterium]